MDLQSLRLHRLPISLKLAVSFLIFVMVGGLLTSVLHMQHHYENKDGREGLSLVDIRGSFHGVNEPSRMLDAINGSMRQYVESEEEFNALTKWLESDRINEDYDSLALGDFAPIEIIELSCLRCHGKDAREGGGIHKSVPLETFDDVKKVAFSLVLDPVPDEILTTSTHTHALTMPLVGIVTSLLLLGSVMPRKHSRVLVCLTFLGLFVDIGCWWLARENPFFCYGIVAGGAVFGGLAGLELIIAFISTWIGGFYDRVTDEDGIVERSERA